MVILERKGLFSLSSWNTVLRLAVVITGNYGGQANGEAKPARCQRNTLGLLIANPEALHLHRFRPPDGEHGAEQYRLLCVNRGPYKDLWTR